MVIKGEHRQSLWYNSADPAAFYVFDQRQLPDQLPEKRLATYEEAATAIRDMWVRGAPLIGVTAAFGMYLAALQAQQSPTPIAFMEEAQAHLLATRPTAVNLSWALTKQEEVWRQADQAQWPARLLAAAESIRAADIEQCKAMGEYGKAMIASLYAALGRPVNIMTHCNAGWLATIDYGTATAPMYLAHAAGIPIHVWVSETRPRNQGFSITAFEMAEAGVPHTLLVDNAAGLLMQQGKVDVVIVGSDRTAANGDVANKIGTYLKALAAHDNAIPFYVAVPSSSIDFSLHSGNAIPIEERDATEVTSLQGYTDKGLQTIRLSPPNSPAVNVGFDVTPAKYVTGLITEKGICPATAAGLAQLFPDKYHTHE